MKVLHVLPNAGSGIETLVVSMLPYFRQQTIETHLLYLSDAIAPVAAAGSDAHSLTHLNIRAAPLRTVTEYRHMVNTLRPDIVHTHSMLPSLLATTGNRTDARHVRTVHAPYPYFSAPDVRSVIKRRMEGMALKHTRSTVVCVSNAVAKSLPWRLSRPVVTIHNGVRPDQPAIVRREAGDPLVIAVGRLEAQKGYPRLLESFAHLQRTEPDLQLAIAGEGSQRKILEAMIRTLRLESHVKLLGQVTDVYALYQSASLFVCSSDYEGLVLSAMEALCAGCPVVSTPIEPSYEIDTILGGGIIRFASDFSPESLSHAMRVALHESADHVSPLADRTATARRILSADNCAGQYLELYRGDTRGQLP